MTMTSMTPINRIPHKLAGMAVLMFTVMSASTSTAAESKAPATGATTSVSAAAPLPHLEWLAGVWRAPFRGGIAEDVYEPANNGEVLSTFKLVVDGKVTRYELRSLHEQDGKFIFHELVYGPNLTPADPVPDRVLVSSDDTHINFEGLTFTRTGENSMHVELTTHSPDGSARVFNIDYTRTFKFTAP